MQTIACENGGIHHTIPDSSTASLKEAMANYFVYLAAGMHPATLEQDPTVRWVDVYEDGQGRGQLTAACSPVYNFGTESAPENPPQLFAVVCLGIPWPTWKDLDEADSVWDEIQSSQEICPNLDLTWCVV